MYEFDKTYAWDNDHAFKEAVQFVLGHEGGYGDDEDDTGGATKYGISLRFYKDKIHLNATPEDIRNLNLDEAIDIYYKFFWNGYPFKYLETRLSKRLFSFAVNMGHKPAFKLLQRALRACGHNHIIDDGIIGRKTKKALQSTDLNQLIPSLRSEAAGYYRSICEAKPSQKKFLNGWLDRAYD